MNNLTVLILAAGYGRRMGPFSRIINKGLVPYDNKPLVSHIIEKFDPTTTKFVIACGHMGQQIKDYVSLVHQEKNVVFVDIPDYAEDHTGPATSIQHCAEHLTGGFLWVSCDTLFDFDYANNLDHNWIAVHPVDSTISKDYCWVTRNGESIVDVHNKIESNAAVDAFIGLMYCRDDQYLTNLNAVHATQPHEGFVNLDLKAHTVHNWLDFGTYDKWQEIAGSNAEIGFAKTDELFYMDNSKIIKFNVDQNLVDRRFARAELNPACMPSNVKAAGQFLAYDRAPGGTMYEYASPELLGKLLDWYDSTVWREKWFPDVTKYCEVFYHQKSLDRLQQFRIKYNNWTEPNKVNDKSVRSIDEYVALIDWNYICSTPEWKFIHGDGHWDNIIYNPETDSFTAIDWRTDFAGSNYGDVYYDLAKMTCGIYCNFQYLKNNPVEYQETEDSVTINVPSVDGYEDYIRQLRAWCLGKNLDWHKIQLMVPIIFMNISALHSAPYDKFLFTLAQLKFAEYYDGV